MNCTEQKPGNGICRSMMKKISDFRQGNRLMLSHDMNASVALYKRSQPEKKCSIVHSSGKCTVSLLDIALYAAAAAALAAVIGAVCSLGSQS